MTAFPEATCKAVDSLLNVLERTGAVKKEQYNQKSRFQGLEEHDPRLQENPENWNRQYNARSSAETA